MSKTVFHQAETRGHANHGWLDSYHTFSFANYFNAERVHFGVLRVLNDDQIAPSMGFGMHPHDNMEIISIPLEGELEHRDSMGNVAIIKQGDIQVMSAGKGIRHSEYNKSQTEVGKFLQIWVLPNQRNVAPRYNQISLNTADRQNKLQQILSPNSEDEGVWIHQDAWFYLGSFEKGFAIQYDFKKSGNGLYAFVIRGSFTIDNQVLKQRDGFGIWETDNIKITSMNSDSEILLMEVPMEI
jgi:hypothetical protein